MKLGMVTVLVVAALGAAEKPNARDLLDMAKRAPQSAGFRSALLSALGEEALQKGTAVIGEGPAFLWAVEAESTPRLFVDDAPVGQLRPIKGSRLWYRLGTLATGTSHFFYYEVAGRRFGGRNDVPAYTPDSYEHPGVSQGTLSEKLIHHSSIYPGMTSEYWIYVPAQYRPGTPAALMVWQDGQGHVERNGAARTLNVIDNLIHAKKIPVMIQVFIAPGMASSRRMRSIEYDTVDDTYARFLRDELLPEVYKKYDIRRDSYSRAIAGISSGGICAFNVAWQQPDQFSRVLSHVGSFTSIQWKPGERDGGNVYPFKIRKEAKRNIRVWLQDGAEDLENEHGSWPLQNLQMANSLKLKDYDFHLSWGSGSHNAAHGNAEAPQELTWLWRDYDPARTQQIYEMEPAERAKPLFRVRIANR